MKLSILIFFFLSLLLNYTLATTTVATADTLPQATETAALPDLSDTPWANFKVPPGTKLTINKSPKGQEIKTLDFPGGVAMSARPDGSIRATDNSGKGAVFCSWSMYVELKKTLESCPSVTRLKLNYEEAYFWFSLVPTSGANHALASREAAEAAKHLTSEQITAINKRVAAWEPRPTSVKTSNFEKNKTMDLSDEDQEVAAEKGDVEAQFSVGAKYEGKNYEEAAKWYRKAAEQGKGVAQYRLGLLYTSESNGGMDDKDFEALLDEAIDKTNNFIVANSLTPTTKEELEDKIKQSTSYGCAPRGIINRFKAHSPEKFRSATDDLLSISRPPVMEPCL